MYYICNIYICIIYVLCILKSPTVDVVQWAGKVADLTPKL